MKTVFAILLLISMGIVLERLDISSDLRQSTAQIVDEGDLYDLSDV